MINNKGTTVDVITKEGISLVLTSYLNKIDTKYDINSLLKITVSTDLQSETREYFANLSRALVKTIKKYCNKELFIPSNQEYYKAVTQELFNEINFEIVITSQFRNKNIYGVLFRILCEKLKLRVETNTDEMVLSQKEEFIAVGSDLSRNEPNCILVSFCKASRKIYFLEKSRGNINKQYLLSYLRRL